jgi:hypothetical protein
MKIPDKIKIAGKEYKIQYDEGIYYRDHNRGEVNYNTEIITIYSKASKQQQEEVLCHEIVHIILRMIDNDINNEKLVGAFGELLYQAIKQL